MLDDVSDHQPAGLGAHLFCDELARATTAAGEAAHLARRWASVLALATDTCPWDGAGARAFRDADAAALARLRAAAARLELAADAVTQYRVALEREIAENEAGTAAAERRGAHLVSDVLNSIIPG